MNKKLIYSAVAFMMLQGLFYVAPLDAFRIRIGSDGYSSDGRTWYWGDRHWGHDHDRHWNDDRQLGRNFVFRGSHRISDIDVDGDDDRERTYITLDNGRVFRIRGSELPMEEGDKVNVFRKRTGDGEVRHRLVINRYEYKARRVD